MTIIFCHPAESIAASGLGSAYNEAIIQAQSFLTPAPTSDMPSSWASGDVSKAKEYGLIPNEMYKSFTSNISRSDFCKLAMALYTKITGITLDQELLNPFSDTNELSVLNAYELGIVKGTGGDMFSPRANITRQEIAVMLKNTIEVIDDITGRDILNDVPSPLTFTDKILIADWAADAVSVLRSNKIIFGVENDRFDPIGSTTREMAFILINRVYLIYSGLDAGQSFPSAYTGEIIMSHKGHFRSPGSFSIIVDVHELYPDVSLSQIESILDGARFSPGTGVSYSMDKSESLSESVSNGYTSVSANNYYPIYVFVNEADENDKLYMKLYFGTYHVYRDEALTLPLTITTFSDVIFKIDGDARVYINDDEYTFDMLRTDSPELLDAYLFNVRLSRGTISRLAAVTN